MNSDTPETDAHIARPNNRFESEVDADFARKLERERDEARKTCIEGRIACHHFTREYEEGGGL